MVMVKLVLPCDDIVIKEFAFYTRQSFDYMRSLILTIKSTFTLNYGKNQLTFKNGEDFLSNISICDVTNIESRSLNSCFGEKFLKSNKFLNNSFWKTFLDNQIQ